MSTKNISAGLLMFRFIKGEPEFFLVHPGGPYFTNKDKGWWTIPKGLPDENEELADAAKREFEEETGIKPKNNLIALGSVKQKGGKTVHGWAFEADLPEGWELKCNSFKIQWPPKSGKWQDCSEVDKARFFKFEDALEHINEAQQLFITRLLEHIHQK